jgi:hypothetical protein
MAGQRLRARPLAAKLPSPTETAKDRRQGLRVWGPCDPETHSPRKEKPPPLRRYARATRAARGRACKTMALGLLQGCVR